MSSSLGRGEVSVSQETDVLSGRVLRCLGEGLMFVGPMFVGLGEKPLICG